MDIIQMENSWNMRETHYLMGKIFYLINFGFINRRNKNNCLYAINIIHTLIDCWAGL